MSKIEPFNSFSPGPCFSIYKYQDIDGQSHSLPSKELCHTISSVLREGQLWYFGCLPSLTPLRMLKNLVSVTFIRNSEIHTPFNSCNVKISWFALVANSYIYSGWTSAICFCLFSSRVHCL